VSAFFKESLMGLLDGLAGQVMNSLAGNESAPQSGLLEAVGAMLGNAQSGGLAGLGCYERRDEAIRSVFPEFNSSWSAKITIPTNILEKETFNFFHLTIENSLFDLTRHLFKNHKIFY
jgi:hypothetical protein